MEQPQFDVKALIAEVAKRHKILLAPDDPAFVLITMNELVLQQLLLSLQRRFTEMEQMFSRVSDKHLAVAKATGEAMITAGAAFVSDRMKEAIAVEEMSDRRRKPNNERPLARFVWALTYLIFGVTVGLAAGLVVARQL